MSDDHAPPLLLLSGIDSIEADLAKNLLSAEGIPTLAKGPDFDVAELGRAAHDMIRGTDLYVPAAAYDRAKALLEAAWGSLEGEPAADDPEAQES